MNTRIHSILFILVSWTAIFPRSSFAQVTVNWGTTYQTIDGFGVSDAFQGSGMSSGNADTLFSTTAGAGLSLLRTLVPSGAPDSPGNCSSVSSSCAGNNTGDMSLAVARGARIWSAPWTPPASMKSNGSYTNGGSLLAGSYAAYSSWLTNYVKSVSTYGGVNLYAISVQNEPDQTTSYDSATWSGQNIHDFILNNLGPSFASAGLSTKIMLPEPSCTNLLGSYADPTMTDANAAAYVGIVASHDYCGSPVSYTTGGKPMWETEVSTLSGSFDASIGTAISYAQQIHGWMTNNATAWGFWTWHSGNPSQQLIDISSGTVSKTLWVMGNFSRFVRPGWVRIEATANPSSGVYVSAYENASTGAFAVVAINANGSPSTQTFNLTGASASSVTPWVTSGSINLASQSPVSISGGAFTATLAAQSVVTFVGQSSASQTLSPCDVNGDGVTNAADVTAEINQALGVSSCTADINRDGTCNVVDVQRVVNAVGGACVSP